jgi:cell division transport system permease protein
MKLGGSFGAAAARLLPEGRLSGPMPWVIAIMMFLTVLAAALGLGLSSAAAKLDGEVGSRITVQIVEANPDSRERQARAALALLERQSRVTAVRRVSDEELADLLEPWLGEGSVAAEVPIPALIDAELAPGTAVEPIRAALAPAAPAARVDDSAQWLAPLGNLVAALKWLAVGLVLLMVAATAATVSSPPEPRSIPTARRSRCST